MTDNPFPEDTTEGDPIPYKTQAWAWITYTPQRAIGIITTAISIAGILAAAWIDVFIDYTDDLNDAIATTLAISCISAVAFCSWGAVASDNKTRAAKKTRNR